MKIAIVGAGPSGLFAAYAAYERGHVVQLFDPAPFTPDRILPLQYLHDPTMLPNEALRDLRLNWKIVGEDPKLVEAIGLEKTAQYMYNAKLHRPLSEENSTRYAWQSTSNKVYSLRTACAWLHKLLEPLIVPVALNWWQLEELTRKGYDAVVSTVPLNLIAPNPDDFKTIDMSITPGYSPVKDHPADTCILNLDPKVSWIRATDLDGGIATEWVEAKMARPAPNVLVLPLRKIAPPHALPALPERVFLAGRWGSWDAGTLTHHSYYRVQNIMEMIK